MYTHKNIIKIVGNAACKCTDGFHFLGLAKLGLKPYTIGDIPGHSINTLEVLVESGIR